MLANVIPTSHTNLRNTSADHRNHAHSNNEGDNLFNKKNMFKLRNY